MAILHGGWKPVCGIAALLYAATVVGCNGGGGLVGSGDPLSAQADCVRRSVPRIPPVPRELDKTFLPNYRLDPGDTVLVEAQRFESPLRFPADQIVMPDGTIDLGRFGRPRVAGQTVEQVERIAEDLVAADYSARAAADTKFKLPENPLDLRVDVRLIEPAGSLFYVLGAVASPGAYPLTGRETALDAILAAGGLSDSANRSKIVVSRPSVVSDCRTVLPVCYDHVTQLGDSTTNYQILPGDRVFVPTYGCCEKMMAKLMHSEDDFCCHPQCPCGPGVKGCPAPTSYRPCCPDPAGVNRGPSYGAIFGDADTVPAPAPAPATDGDGRDEPVTAPKPGGAGTGDADTTGEAAVELFPNGPVDPAQIPELPDVPELDPVQP